MKQLAVIETVGNIFKVEKLTTLEKNVLPNTLVLRNTNPFPGYVYKDPHHETDLQFVSIFIALQYRYAHEKALKLSIVIQRQLQLECRTGFGEIWCEDKYIPCIRIKGLKYISSIPKVQGILKDQGFKLMRNDSINQEAKIRVYKSFKILEIQDDLYRDYYEREKFYIKCPYDIEWEFFEIINHRVKQHLQKPIFLTALGEIYRFNGPEKIIRIADKDKSLERAIEIKNLYQKELRHEVVYS